MSWSVRNNVDVRDEVDARFIWFYRAMGVLPMIRFLRCWRYLLRINEFVGERVKIWCIWRLIKSIWSEEWKVTVYRP